MPSHVAIIMDGNGRWAIKRGLKRKFGHKKGADRIIEIVRVCSELGIKALTVYAFSTENWKRDKEEIDYIFYLLEDLLNSKSSFLIKENVQVRLVGNLDRLIGEYDSLRESFLRIIENTKHNTGLVFNVAFNYGGHDEIVRVTKEISSDISEGKIKTSDINEKLFEQYLYTKEYSNVDLLIRTSGEIRISNFLLWQIAYSEFVFTKTNWPDFTKNKLIKCIAEYQRRNRRFGNIK